jgi:hypothetical protein
LGATFSFPALWFIAGAGALAQVDRDATAYRQAVTRINEDHARNPGRTTENELAKKLPFTSQAGLQRVVQAKPSPQLAPALRECAEAALDLAALNDFEAARRRLQEVAPEEAKKLGDVVGRPRFIVRGVGDFAPDYLTKFADLFEAVLLAYDEVFGFTEFSKVPGKKLRVRLRLEPSITAPPHFAPEFPWHSEIDFPVVNPTEFRSPTAQGQFLFYGLCHELGHVIAMWGDVKTMEDQHAWAHYTGVVITEHMAAKMKGQPLTQTIADERWRSLTNERKAPANQVPPSFQNTASVMALFIALHDVIGPHGFGDALNWLEREGKARRVNRVRYYSFADLRRALGATVADPAKKKSAVEILENAQNASTRHWPRTSNSAPTSCFGTDKQPSAPPLARPVVSHAPGSLLIAMSRFRCTNASAAATPVSRPRQLAIIS